MRLLPLFWHTAWASLLLALLLTGCAAPVGPSGDLVTSSDQTEVDRRAALRLELAASYYGRGQLEVALDEVKQSLAIKPDAPSALSLRGLIYLGLEQARLSEDSFKRALQLAPQDPDILHNYGWALCQLGRLEEASRQFEAALAQPRYREKVRTWLALGVCLGKGQRWTEASQSLGRAFETEPGNPVLGFHYAESLYKLGQHDKALFYLKRVLSRPEWVSPQALWLAARIEHAQGRTAEVQSWGRKLQGEFPQSKESLAFERGRFND